VAVAAGETIADSDRAEKPRSSSHFYGLRFDILKRHDKLLRGFTSGLPLATE
jgi:hypothetical protein